MEDELQNLRKELDDIDGRLLALLAERFRVTQEVGRLKSRHGITPQDKAREEALFARIEKQATEAGLDPLLARRLWRQIIDEVLKNHAALQNGAGNEV